MACGWERTSEIVDIDPLLINECLIGRTRALCINRFLCLHRESNVVVTPPSTEFSIGTTAASQRLFARLSTTDLKPLNGKNSGESSFSRAARAFAAFSA